MSFLPDSYKDIDCRADKCPTNPHGARYRGVRKCSGCPNAFDKEGKPFVNEKWQPRDGKKNACPKCHGEGTLNLMTLEGGKVTCPKCNGTGLAPKRRGF